MVKIGFEQEFSFKNHRQEYLDFTNTDYQLFNTIVAEFPVIPGDEQVFECKSLETVPRRCYVEGLERYDLNGHLVSTDPKGLELRTTPHTRIDDLIAEFRESFKTMVRIAEKHGIYPLLVSRNPFRSEPSLERPLNEKERSLRTEDELNVALKAMLTYAFHINVSVAGNNRVQAQALAEKINHYMPCIIPYSFSSPFCDGQLSEYLCTRTLMRAGYRQLVDVSDRKGVHVIQFRGYDPCGDLRILRGILFLTKGLALDTSLTGKSEKQDADLIMHSCRYGFASASIKASGLEVLQAVQTALGDEGHEIEPLRLMLYNNDSGTKRIREKYARCKDIVESISDLYNF